jgi:hypothetical protein
VAWRCCWCCAGLKRIANWNLDFMSNSDEGKAYMDLVRLAAKHSSSSSNTAAAAAPATQQQQQQQDHLDSTGNVQGKARTGLLILLSGRQQQHMRSSSDSSTEVVGVQLASAAAAAGTGWRL